MTPRQTAKYWSEWRRIAEPMQRAGKTRAQIEAFRHEVTKRALGKWKSSKHLTNADLDKIFAAFAALHSSDDLDAQIKIQDSPEMRVEGMLGRCNTAMETISPGRDGSGYLATIAHNTGSALKWPPKDEATLRRVMGIVETRANAIRRKQATEAKNREDPF